MITANQLMLQSMCDLLARQGQELSPHLKEYLAEGIIEEDGCWFLARKRRGNKQAVQAMQDRTGLECFVNKIYINGKDDTDFVRVQQQGFLLVTTLLGLLEPHGVFNIILDFSRTKSGSVRFHQVRPAEARYLRPDSDEYLSNAMLVFTTDKTPNPGIICEATWPTA
jgi:hypothetical protein